MQYLLGGLSQIDVEDWKRNTEYSGYQPTDQVVLWFWKAVENYDEEMRARLLQFVTGTSKVPMNGFSELQGQALQKKLQTLIDVMIFMTVYREPGSQKVLLEEVWRDQFFPKSPHMVSLL